MRKIFTTLIALQICLVSAVEAKTKKIENFIKQGSTKVMYRSMDLKDLAQSAGIIFKGSLISQSNSDHNGIPVTLYKFRIEDAITGIKTDQKLITLKIWSELDTPLSNINKDESHVFFFAQPSTLGLTSSYGSQGIVDFSNQEPVLKTRTEYKKLDLAHANLKAALSEASSVEVQEKSIKNYEDLKRLCKSYISEGKQ